jgi:hypothetical protein
VAEGGGLLNRYTAITRIVGSNPIPSATIDLIGQQNQLISGNSAIIPIFLPRLFSQIIAAVPAELLDTILCKRRLKALASWYYPRR